MTELGLILIIAVLSLILTIMSSNDNISGNEKVWYKRLTKRGQTVLLIGLLIVSLSITQATVINRKETRKEKNQEQQRKTSDSIISSEIKKGVEVNSQHLFNDITLAFAKQKLKLDTVTKSIENLRDSAKTVIINSPKEDPIIIVREDGITHLLKNDSIEFKLNIVSTQAPCKIIFINYFCEVNFVDGTKSNTFLAATLLKGVILIPKEQPLSLPFWIYPKPKKEIDYVNIALVGKYTQTESKKEILLQDIYKYPFATKKVSFLASEEKAQFFKKYYIRNTL